MKDNLFAYFFSMYLIVLSVLFIYLCSVTNTLYKRVNSIEARLPVVKETIMYQEPFTNVTRLVMLHGLKTKNVTVSCLGDRYSIEPDRIEIVDENRVALTFSHAVSGLCRVVADK